MKPKVETQRLEAALRCRAVLDEALVEEGAGLVRAEGLDRAMAFWLSRKEKGWALASTLSAWWLKSSATSFLWRHSPVSPFELLDALFLLSPHQMEFLAEEAEAFLTEVKYAQAAASAEKGAKARPASETSAAENKTETQP